MRITVSVLVATALGLWSGIAGAAATWSVHASMSDGSPIDAATYGAQLILEIGLIVDGPELAGISGSVNDYDRNILSPAAWASTIPDRVLCEFQVPILGGCVNGANNLEDGLRVQNGLEGRGAEDTFLSILETQGVPGTGAVDDPYPQFRLVYDIISPGATTLRIGTFADYADAYTTVSGPGVVNNVTVDFVVAPGGPIPEPSTALMLGIGLAGLARRRPGCAANPYERLRGE